MDKDRSDKLIDGIKLALAIRQLENSVVLHDCLDLEFESVESILNEYSILDSWSQDELEILKSHLYDMAFEAEAREAERWAEKETCELLLSVPLRSAPSPRLLALQHKVWKGAMAEQMK